MRILLTGATGFIGRNLAPALLGIGHQVDALVRNLPAADCSIEDVRYHKVESTNFSSVYAAVERANPELTVHLAACLRSGEDPEDMERIISSNVGFTSVLAAALHKFSGAFLLLNTTSYFQNPLGGPYGPTNIYGASKEAAQTILTYYALNESATILNLRLMNVYGPGDDRSLLMNDLLLSVKGNVIAKMTPGEQKLDFVYIDDVVDAYIQALSHFADGSIVGMKTYNVSTGVFTTPKQLVGVFDEVLGSSVKVVWGARPYSSHICMCPASSEDILPGWTPKTSLREGVTSILDYSGIR